MAKGTTWQNTYTHLHLHKLPTTGPGLAGTRVCWILKYNTRVSAKACSNGFLVQGSTTCTGGKGMHACMAHVHIARRASWCSLPAMMDPHWPLGVMDTGHTVKG